MIVKDHAHFWVFIIFHVIFTVFIINIIYSYIFFSSLFKHWRYNICITFIRTYISLKKIKNLKLERKQVKKDILLLICQILLGCRQARLPTTSIFCLLYVFKNTWTKQKMDVDHHFFFTVQL